nr:hypothetical protein [uncultured Campylobacter sp.]
MRKERNWLFLAGGVCGVFPCGAVGWLSLRTLLVNFRLGSPARSSETFRAVFCARR